MPYFLSPMIRKSASALWLEGAPYHSETIYDIRDSDPKKPPVHYEAHTLKPHSLCHMDAPGHTIPGGATVDHFFETPERMAAFSGKAVVIKVEGSKWVEVPGIPGTYHHEVGLEELESAVTRVTGRSQPPDRILIAPSDMPQTPDGQHASQYAFTLSRAAALWLDSSSTFRVFGTSWKSTDFQPGSRERPIHEIMFRKAAIFECLKLAEVPEGVYFWVAFPLPLVGATEAPVAPVLFSCGEVEEFIVSARS